MRDCLVFCYLNGQITESCEGVTFSSEDCLSFYVDQHVSFDSFCAEIVSRSRGGSISSITYRFPISVIQQKVEYRPYLLRGDDDIRLLFDFYSRYYPAISAAEVNVVLGFRGEAGPSQPAPEAAGILMGDYGDSDDEDDPNYVCSEEEEGANEMENQCANVIESEEEDLPADMYYLDLDAMNASEFPDLLNAVHIPTSNEEELQVGLLFLTKEDVQHRVKHYSVRKFVDYKVVRSNPSKYLVQCQRFGEGCNWRLSASFIQKRGMWEITRYNGPHTCSARDFTQDHAQLDSTMISRCIIPLVKQNTSLSISVLQAEIKSRYKHEPSYRKTWITKQKAVESLFGNWENSFAELPAWLNALKHFVPGSVVRLQRGPWYDENNNIDATKKVFRRLFWSFGPCIEAFKYCKRIVQIDGTHLYGKYRGTLLVAVSRDGNRNIVPLAFAIVEGETLEAWEFFLYNLRRHVTPQDGVCFISDRHKSIISVMKNGGEAWQPPRAYHVYYIRHIGANVLQCFNNQVLKNLVVNAGYAKTPALFTQYMIQIQSISPALIAWLGKIGSEKWMHAYDGGVRYGHMTTNLVEYINSVLKRSRYLPIKALVESTYHRLAKLFATKERNAAQQIKNRKTFSDVVMVLIESNREAIANIRVHEMDISSLTFRPEELVGQYQGMSSTFFSVDLRNRWCDCGEFQGLRFPCCHVLAGCSYGRIDWTQYVYHVYRWENIYNIYRRGFEVIPNEAYWPTYDGEWLKPDPKMKRNPSGRPRSTRIHNAMDIHESGGNKRCGVCHQIGHNRNHCPTRCGTSE